MFNNLISSIFILASINEYFVILLYCDSTYPFAKEELLAKVQVLPDYNCDHAGAIGNYF